MNLQSPAISISKPAAYLFEKLTQVSEYEKLMPDTISKFEVLSDDAFIFALKGMPEIKLKMKQTEPTHRVVLGAASDKLPFTLEAKISETSPEQSQVQLFFTGEFNAMMAMMIKGPIGKFIDTLAQNMTKL